MYKLTLYHLWQCMYCLQQIEGEKKKALPWSLKYKTKNGLIDSDGNLANWLDKNVEKKWEYFWENRTLKCLWTVVRMLLCWISDWSSLTSYFLLWICTQAQSNFLLYHLRLQTSQARNVKTRTPKSQIIFPLRKLMMVVVDLSVAVVNMAVLCLEYKQFSIVEILISTKKITWNKVTEKSGRNNFYAWLVHHELTLGPFNLLIHKSRHGKQLVSLSRY